MDLVITNVDVPQDGPPSSSLSDPRASSLSNIVGPDPNRARKRDPPHRVEVTHTIATVDPDTQLYSWDRILVSEGNYMLLANFNTTTDVTPKKSAAFYVGPGTDTSCLVVTQPTSQTSTGSTTPTQTGGTDPPPSSSPPTTPAPVGTTSTVNKGAIAGGVVGALAVIAAIFAAFLFFRCSPGRRDAALAKWGNLNSYDSKAPNSRGAHSKTKVYPGQAVGLAGMGRDSSSGRHKHHSESTSGIMALQTGEQGSPGNSDDNLDEKYSRSDISHEMITVGYGSPPRNSARDSSSSSNFSYAQNNNYSRPRSQSTKYGLSPQTVPESVSVTTFNSRRASSPPIGGRRYSESFYPPSPAYPSGLSGVVFNGTSPSPLGGVPSDSDLSLASPGPVTPAPAATRRTPRKPVPKYSPGEEQHPDLPTDVQDDDLAGVPHVLTHKNSHGSFKQMHYLIPDMPPPQRD